MTYETALAQIAWSANVLKEQDGNLTSAEYESLMKMLKEATDFIDLTLALGIRGKEKIKTALANRCGGCYNYLMNRARTRLGVASSVTSQKTGRLRGRNRL